MTQNQQILAHLKEYGSITPLQALNEYGCMRLGARIYDLKASRHDIPMTMETHVNSKGEEKRYAKYWIPMDKKGA